ncbi:hypothetical protein DITRI_Ditri06bG0095900 [Diplodiscus trichospermus]
MSRLEKIRVACGMTLVFGVDSIGSSGGLAMFWRDDVNLSSMGYANSYIDMHVLGSNGEGEWRLTGIYGVPDHVRR